MTLSDVTPFESKQTAPACRFTITASLSGFPIVIEGEGRAGDLKLIIDRLKLIGAEPPAQAASKASNAGNTPVCPEHGTAKPSKRPGSFYCPKSLPDGGYCKWVGKA